MPNLTFFDKLGKTHKKIMLKILKPILLRFFTTTAVKRLVIDLLRTIATQTTNKLDDKAVDILEKQLFPDK